MKGFKLPVILLVALMLTGIIAPVAMAECEDAKSLTVTIDRRVMPQTIYHPGRLFQRPKTVTVTLHDFVIRDYAGMPTDGFTIQTNAGQTKIPLDAVKELQLYGEFYRRTDDIYLSENLVRSHFSLTDGREVWAFMNPDFGTIEGKTGQGDFFLKEPHAVKRLVFSQ